MSGMEIHLLWLHTGPQQFAALLIHRGFGYWLIFHCLSPISHSLDFFGTITGSEVLSSLNQAGQTRYPSPRMWIMSHAIQTDWKWLEKFIWELSLGHTVQVFLPPRLPGTASLLSAPSLMIGPSLQTCVFTFTLQEIPFLLSIGQNYYLSFATKESWVWHQR